MNREALNAYDLGLPLVVAPVEERRQRVPAKVWAMVYAAKAAVDAEGIVKTLVVPSDPKPT